MASARRISIALSTLICYTYNVNQPRLTTGKTAPDQSRRVNSMKDNARHVPSSTRSCRRTFVSIRVDSWLIKNTYKTQTKCRQNHKCKFFNSSVSITYNFNAVTCLNFTDPNLNLAPNLNLNQPSAPRLGPGRYPFSLGEKVGMRDKLITLCRDTGCRNKLINTVQNGTKRDNFERPPKTTTSYQRFTTTPPEPVPFCRRWVD